MSDWRRRATLVASGVVSPMSNWCSPLACRRHHPKGHWSLAIGRLTNDIDETLKGQLPVA
ncbi:hypothetical protein [Nostoc sp.]